MQINELFLNRNAGFWVGIVEDRNDPEKLGRARVRIIGFHTENLEDIPTEALPWAYPTLPLNTPPQTAPVGPVEGSTILGFFADGLSAQIPIMLAVIPGKNVKATPV